jgi:hypothetical protein
VPDVGLRSSSAVVAVESHRRLAVLSARQVEEQTRFVRLVQGLNPDLPEDDQARWLGLAEALVVDELRAWRRRAILLWSHVAPPGVVTVDGPGVRYRVGIDERDGVATLTVLERAP